MFKKSLIVSVIFHLLLCAGLGLVSDHPDNLRAARKQSPLLMVALDSDIPSETVFLKGGDAGNDGQRETLIRSEGALFKDHPEQTTGISMAGETPPNPLTDNEKNNTDIDITGPGRSEVGDNDFPFEPSGPETEPIGLAGNSQSQDSALHVDRLPVKLYAPTPAYPFLARKNQWEGVTLLEILVRADGLIGETSIIQSSGYRVLDRAAVKAVKRWRYRPAFKNGKAVAWRLRVRVKFILEE